MATNRDFKGVWIPKEIWLNKNLTLQEKVFLVEIDSLDNEDGCFASNSYFSEFFGLTKGRCTQIIKLLEGKGLITIELERSGKQVVRRLIRVVNILNTPSENIKHPYLENDEDNNTTISNTIINNITTTKKTIKKEPSKKYGEYKNVLLTDKQLEQLKGKFRDWENRIRILDEGIEQHGYKYKNHYLAIIKWAQKDAERLKMDNRGLRNLPVTPKVILDAKKPVSEAQSLKNKMAMDELRRNKDKFLNKTKI